MTVGELAERLSLRPLAAEDADREATGVYIGDLLSWVMGRAQSGDVWVTIMSNINVVAVASLADVACIVFAEDVVPDEKVIATAKEKGVNLFTTEMTAFEVAVMLADLKK